MYKAIQEGATVVAEGRASIRVHAKPVLGSVILKKNKVGGVRVRLIKGYCEHVHTHTRKKMRDFFLYMYT